MELENGRAAAGGPARLSERARYIPLRLDAEERRLLRLLEVLPPPGGRALSPCRASHLAELALGCSAARQPEHCSADGTPSHVTVTKLCSGRDGPA